MKVRSFCLLTLMVLVLCISCANNAEKVTEIKKTVDEMKLLMKTSIELTPKVLAGNEEKARELQTVQERIEVLMKKTKDLQATLSVEERLEIEKYTESAFREIGF